jgi:ABC-type transporter Mla MlaB component
MDSTGPLTVTFAVRGPIARSDLPGLCDRVCELLSGRHPAEVLCDVAGVPADAVTVDALARLQLAARRTGCLVRLRDASADLRALVAFMGLEDVLPDSSIRVRRSVASARELGRAVRDPL